MSERSSDTGSPNGPDTGIPTRPAQELDDESVHRFSIRIDADHPTFAGHFPGHPVLPGVSLLDLVIDGVHRHLGLPEHQDHPFTLRMAKFHSMVEPGSMLDIEFDRADPTGFSVQCGERRIASGTFDGLWPNAADDSNAR